MLEGLFRLYAVWNVRGVVENRFNNWRGCCAVGDPVAAEVCDLLKSPIGIDYAGDAVRAASLCSNSSASASISAQSASVSISDTRPANTSARPLLRASAHPAGNEGDLGAWSMLSKLGAKLSVRKNKTPKEACSFLEKKTKKLLSPPQLHFARAIRK